MIPETLLSLGHKALRVFKVFGRLEFVRRLYDFLAHEGRRSRVETLEHAAKVVLELEKAEAQRIRNTKALIELMKASNFSDEQIQVALSNPTEINRVSAALSTILHYVNNGSVTVKVVAPDESPIRPTNSLDRREVRRKLLAKKSSKK